ncbi:MAG: RHS domain-containing protein, partial [Gammaproteobacteria bacterium]|nr:RHS domain-containing protein [Gammaproteobacteria bacterium]
STAGLEQFFSELPSLLASMVDGLISSANAALGDGAIYYVHNDHLGTPKAMTNEFGVKVWSAVHDPFGQATVDPASTVVLNVRFPGQYYDAESGLHYNYFRYYDPSNGRYLTSDPIGLRGGLNTFGYVGGNPVNWIDPLGLWLRTPGGGYITKDPEGGYQSEKGCDSFTNDLIDAMNEQCKANPAACKYFDDLIRNPLDNVFDDFENRNNRRANDSHTEPRTGNRNRPSAADMFLKDFADAAHEAGHGGGFNDGTHSSGTDTSTHDAVEESLR